MASSELCPIVVDTREQKPWVFDPATTTTTSRALSSGDYSVAGLEEVVAIERKSLDDFVGSISTGRERFLREIVRLRQYEYKAVVVEATLQDVAAHCYRSQMHPSAVIGTAVSLSVDYGVPVLWLESREYASRYVERTLRRIWMRSSEDNRRAESGLLLDAPETGE